MREILGIQERFQALRRMTTKEFRKNFTRDQKRSKLLVRIGLISRKLPDSEPVEKPLTHDWVHQLSVWSKTH